MDDREFFRTVAQRSGLSRQEAADVTRATLETLADRLSGGEAQDLAAQLPDGLREYLRAERNKGAKRFGLDEFVDRISQRNGLKPAETRTALRAVFTTLRDASGDEFDEVMSQLPKEMQNLVTATS